MCLSLSQKKNNAKLPSEIFKRLAVLKQTNHRSGIVYDVTVHRASVGALICGSLHVYLERGHVYNHVFRYKHVLKKTFRSETCLGV